MKKVSLVLYAMLLISSTSAFAEVLPDEDAAKELSTEIMVKVAEGDLDTAFKIMKPYVSVRGAEIDGAIIQSKVQRKQYGQRYGTSIDYEFIDEKKVGDSLLRLRYIEKTEKHALPWTFYFYKTKEGWVLNSFSWNDIFKELFT